jgi:hypothetical protein
VTRLTFLIKRRRLAYTQRVGDFVHGRTFCHVRAVRAEAQVTVVVCFCGGDAWGVGNADGLVGVRVLVVACDGSCHCSFDLGVGVFLVGGGVGGLLESPG